ncbi:MAG TPA: acylphosphatase [Microvirga sp.]|jgi:acylphosphatase|nr:acylphosphatase [Microvirga sp.]
MQPRIVHVVIRGRVQGVGFRAWTQHQAQLRGLEGWVRNRRDGAVEALLSGPGDAVDAMLDACRQGPRTGHVEDVAVSPGDEGLIAQPGSGRFEVLPTA